MLGTQLRSSERAECGHSQRAIFPSPRGDSLFLIPSHVCTGDALYYLSQVRKCQLQMMKWPSRDFKDQPPLSYRLIVWVQTGKEDSSVGMGRHRGKGCLCFVFSVAGTGAGTHSESTCVKWGWGMPQMSGLGMGFWRPLPNSSWFSCSQDHGYDSVPCSLAIISLIPFACFAMAVNPAGPESLWAQPNGIVYGGA